MENGIYRNKDVRILIKFKRNLYKAKTYSKKGRKNVTTPTYRNPCLCK